MHVAICMDVAADRKQLERLLDRTIDKKLEEDPNMPIYAQSYGNKQALLARPFMYDLFFIDLIYDTMDSIQLIRELRNLGVTASIVLCPSKVDLSDQLTEEDRVLLLRQPFRQEDVDEVVGMAADEVRERIPKLELRDITDTIHVVEEEFLYAEKKKDMTLVHLTDGREILSSETIDIFYERSSIFSNVYKLPDQLVVNVSYVAETGLFSVLLKDNRRFRASHRWIEYMLKKSNLPY